MLPRESQTQGLEAVLLEKVLLVMLTVPPLLKRPPPRRSLSTSRDRVVVEGAIGDVHCATIVLEAATTAREGTSQAAGNSEGVGVQVKPLLTWKTCVVPPPEMVTCRPLPSMVKFLEIINGLESIIVPLQLKLMVSVEFALVMASRVFQLHYQRYSWSRSWAA